MKKHFYTSFSDFCVLLHKHFNKNKVELKVILGDLQKVKGTKRETRVRLKVSDVIFSQHPVPNFLSLLLDADSEGCLQLDTRSTSFARLATSWWVHGAACVCRLAAGAASSPPAAVRVPAGF